MPNYLYFLMFCSQNNTNMNWDNEPGSFCACLPIPLSAGCDLFVASLLDKLIGGHMSQFFSYTQPEYVRKLSKFLGSTHLAVESLKRERHQGAKGRAPNYSEASIQSLEKAVNDMASRCEAPDTCFKERFSLAAAYSFKKDAVIARLLGVSRQALGWWRAGTCMPSRLECLAEVLDVPVDWLRDGGEEALPASSHLGGRVGYESLEYRERLYGVCLDVIQSAACAEIEGINRAIGACISSCPELAKLSRRAGGRCESPRLQ